jgi:excisionase family DNA binding protein
MSDQPNRWLRLSEAAEYCACSADTLTRAARDGELKGYKLRRRRSWRFSEADLDAWMRSSAEPLPFTPQLVKTHAS